MVEYVKAPEGCRYVLTVEGLELPRIRSKFDKTSSLYKEYKYNVPKSWIEKGYIEIIKDTKED